MKKNHDNNSDKYESLITPNCKITADQAEDLHFTSFAAPGDSDNESGFFTDEEPPQKANEVVVYRPVLKITTVTEEKKDAPQMFDEMREGEKWSSKYEQVFDKMVEYGKGYKLDVFKGFVTRVWKRVVSEAKNTGGGGDENDDGFEDLERGGV